MAIKTGTAPFPALPDSPLNTGPAAIPDVYNCEARGFPYEFHMELKADRDLSYARQMTVLA